MPPRTPHIRPTRPRKRSRRLIAATLVAMVLPAGCTLGSSPDRRNEAPAPVVTLAVPGASPPIPITVADAGKVVDAYEQANAAANRTFDAKLLSAVEAGGLFELSRAAYKQRAAMPDAELALYQHGYTYVDREFLIPRDTTWFAMAARSQDTAGQLSPGRVLVVFDRDHDGWKATASCWMDPSAWPTLIRGADGRAQAVTDTATVRGAAAPDDLDEAVADLYTTGGQRSGAVLADTPAKTEMRQTPTQQNQVLAPDGTATYRLGQTTHHSVYALATADGGTLVVFDTAVRESDTGTNAQATLYPSPHMQPYVGTYGASTFQIDFLHQTCAYIPVQGRVQLLATRYRVTAVQVAQPGDAT